jgi:hypothetical protein
MFNFNPILKKKHISTLATTGLLQCNKILKCNAIQLPTIGGGLSFQNVHRPFIADQCLSMLIRG